jgi:hypothetical protein
MLYKQGWGGSTTAHDGLVGGIDRVYLQVTAPLVEVWNAKLLKVQNYCLLVFHGAPFVGAETGASFCHCEAAFFPPKQSPTMWVEIASPPARNDREVSEKEEQK